MTHDWFPIPLPSKFEVVDPTEFGIKANELEVSRSPDLTLGVSLDADGIDSKDEVFIPGTEWKGSSIHLLTQTGKSGALHDYRRTLASTTTENGHTRSLIVGRAESLSVVFAKSDPLTIVEWLTNVPDLLWTRLTERAERITTTRRRKEATAEDVRNRKSASQDHMEIQLKQPTLSVVRIGVVPAQFVTEGLPIEHPGFIEYHRGPEGLPDVELRRTVRRAFEFLFGGGLGVLGCSELDWNAQPLTVCVTSACVAGGFSRRHAPALLHEDRHNGLDEELVSRLVGRYVELESDYDLNQAIWLYLHSRNAPLEMASGYVGAAFELLCRGYYKLPANESRSRLFPNRLWEAVAKHFNTAVDGLTPSEDTLEDRNRLAEDLAEVKKRVGSLNAVSGSRLNLLFLTDLGLNFGDTERRALAARNNAAHAKQMAPPAPFATLEGYRALHTLFARALFALLGVPVRYFDYSSDGFPVREVTQGQGG